MTEVPALASRFLKTPGELPDGVPAKIVKIEYGGWSPMGFGEYDVILIENAKDGRSIIIHQHWGPDRGANADWFSAGPKGEGIIETRAVGVIPREIVQMCIEFVEAKVKFAKLGHDVWSILR